SRCDLLLVPEEVRTNDEREYGSHPFLDYLHWDLCDLHADALSWASGSPSSILTAYRTRVSARPDSSPEIYDVRRLLHHRRPTRVPVQSLLEHVQGAEG